MNNRCGSNGALSHKGQERCKLSGHLLAGYEIKAFIPSTDIYTHYLVFGIDTHNDAANTDTPTQILLSMELIKL